MAYTKFMMKELNECIAFSNDDLMNVDPNMVRIQDLFKVVLSAEEKWRKENRKKDKDIKSLQDKLSAGCHYGARDYIGPPTNRVPLAEATIKELKEEIKSLKDPADSYSYYNMSEEIKSLKKELEVKNNFIKELLSDREDIKSLKKENEEIEDFMGETMAQNDELIYQVKVKVEELKSLKDRMKKGIDNAKILKGELKFERERVKLLECD